MKGGVQSTPPFIVCASVRGISEFSLKERLIPGRKPSPSPSFSERPAPPPSFSAKPGIRFLDLEPPHAARSIRAPTRMNGKHAEGAERAKHPGRFAVRGPYHRHMELRAGRTTTRAGAGGSGPQSPGSSLRSSLAPWAAINVASAAASSWAPDSKSSDSCRTGTNDRRWCGVTPCAASPCRCANVE